jgi:hypothetical protein
MREEELEAQNWVEWMSLGCLVWEAGEEKRSASCLFQRAAYDLREKLFHIFFIHWSLEASVGNHWGKPLRRRRISPMFLTLVCSYWISVTFTVGTLTEVLSITEFESLWFRLDYTGSLLLEYLDGFRSILFLLVCLVDSIHWPIRLAPWLIGWLSGK